MEPQLLNDPTQFPSDEIIFSHIGNTKDIWIKLFEFLQNDYPEIVNEWRYYNDGKSWLLKSQRKTKTMFWLSIQQNSFLTTFYFTEKAEQMILESGISDELKNQFVNGKRFNKIRGLTITYNSLTDLEYFKELFKIKLSIK
ncbi:MAG: DUF3788 family protein [Ignavibacteria bacterium]|nr:DUF3788 family protein [Ignavibacteria bacterium]